MGIPSTYPGMSPDCLVLLCHLSLGSQGFSFSLLLHLSPRTEVPKGTQGKEKTLWLEILFHLITVNANSYGLEILTAGSHRASDG